MKCTNFGMIFGICAPKFSSTIGGGLRGVSLAIAGHLGAGGFGFVVFVVFATMEPERESGNLIQNQDFAKQINNKISML